MPIERNLKFEKTNEFCPFGFVVKFSTASGTTLGLNLTSENFDPVAINHVDSNMI